MLVVQRCGSSNQTRVVFTRCKFTARVGSKKAERLSQFVRSQTLPTQSNAFWPGKDDDEKNRARQHTGSKRRALEATDRADKPPSRQVGYNSNEQSRLPWTLRGLTGSPSNIKVPCAASWLINSPRRRADLSNVGVVVLGGGAGGGRDASARAKISATFVPLVPRFAETSPNLPSNSCLPDARSLQ